MLHLLFLLIFVHLVFDFCLQSKFMSDYKGKLPFVMGVHVFVWTYAIWFTASLFGKVPFWVVAFLFLGHWIADKGKIMLIDKENLTDEKDPKVYSRLKYLFHADQLFHILQMVVVALVI